MVFLIIDVIQRVDNGGLYYFFRYFCISVMFVFIFLKGSVMSVIFSVLVNNTMRTMTVQSMFRVCDSTWLHISEVAKLLSPTIPSPPTHTYTLMRACMT